MDFRLNFRGDVRASLRDAVLGPNRHGELFRVASATYDPAADRTTATLNLLTHAASPP